MRDVLEAKVNLKDYVWVVVEVRGGSESFLGLADADGQTFVPVTAAKEQAYQLLAKLPAAGDGAQRQVEAIHRQRIAEEAARQGFLVYLVDETGRVVEKMGAPETH